MKKLISIALALIVVLGLCSCTSKKGTELNLENYEDYLIVEKNLYLSGEKDSTGNYSDIVSDISVKGVSANHTYDDVAVTFHLIGKYSVYEPFSGFSDSNGYRDIMIDEIFTIECNVAGNGEKQITKTVPKYAGEKNYINKNDVEYLVCNIKSIRGKVIETY